MRSTVRTLALAGLVCAAVAPGTAAAGTAVGAPEQVCLRPTAFPNGGFEEPVIQDFALPLQADVPGWSTTASDGVIELWHSGYLGVPADQGSQFAEVVANEPGELFQDVPTLPGERLVWRLAHRGRQGVDTMRVQLGPPGLAPNATRDVATGPGAWQHVAGLYVVPPGQTVTRIGFVPTSGGPDTTFGNFLDGVALDHGICSVSVAKTLRPASDPRRFDLFVGDQAAAVGTGDGGAGGPVNVASPTVTVSERPARGNDGSTPADVASAVRCVDRDTGEIVSQNLGTETTVSFDRPRQVSCRFVNVDAPAVIVQKALVPRTDRGRFDLLVNGRTVARAAGDAAVAGPRSVTAGQVTVSERAASGTRARDYASAIACRSMAGKGPVVAASAGTQTTVAVAPGEVVGCVALNVRRPGAPPPLPPAAVPPIAAAPAAADLRVTAEAVRPRVRAGSTARFRLTVANRGPLTATSVRVIPFVSQPGARVSRLAVDRRGGSDVCVRVARGGLCQLARLAPGDSAEIPVAVRTARPGRLSLVAVARANEPERMPGDNRARAAVTVIAGAGAPHGPRPGPPPVTG